MGNLLYHKGKPAGQPWSTGVSSRDCRMRLLGTNWGLR